MKTICGADCSTCMLRSSCMGCEATGGNPFGKGCLIAGCARSKNQKCCSACGICTLREELVHQFNNLGIEDMDPVSTLYALKGAYINLPYTLPGGQNACFWDDNAIYLGNQVFKRGSDRCYGLAANERYLMVCEYGADGRDAEIVVYKRWK